MQKFNDPTPRRLVGDTKKLPFSITKYINLPRNFAVNTGDIVEILDQRRSRHTTTAPTLQDISTLLWLTQREISHDKSNLDLIHLPYPSAGSIGSIRVLALNTDLGAWVYNRKSHGAEVLLVQSASLDEIMQDANRFFEIGDAVILLFFAQKSVIARYYEHPESLILRDAGVILGVLSLVSELQHVSFCPLGTLGETWLTLLAGDENNELIPAGACVISKSIGETPA